MTTFSFRQISAVAIVALSLVPATIIVAQQAPPPAAGAPAQGQAGPPFGGFGRGRVGPAGQPSVPIEWLVRELNLSDAQRNSVNALLAEDHTAARAKTDSLRQARQALDAAITNVPVDDGLLQAQVQQLSAIEAELALSHARMQAKIFQLLNPDQQSRARELLSQRQQQQPRRARQG